MQAVLILAHKNFKQVIQLVDLLNCSFECFIHFDMDIHLDEKQKQILKEKGVTFLQCYHVNWGAFSIVQSTISLISTALKNPDIEYIHIISGQDWPARKPEDIYSFYEGNKNIYIDWHLAENITKAHEPIVIWQKFFYPYDVIKRKTFFGKIYHRLSLIMQGILRVNKFKKYNINFDLYWGSEWMDLPRDAAQYCVDYMSSHSNVFDLFKTGFCSDEFWIQTILCNESEFRDRIINDNHRYIKWERQNGNYPAVLDERDYKMIKKGNYQFVRKVDIQFSKKLMDMLKEEM